MFIIIGPTSSPQKDDYVHHCSLERCTHHHKEPSVPWRPISNAEAIVKDERDQNVMEVFNNAED